MSRMPQRRVLNRQSGAFRDKLGRIFPIYASEVVDRPGAGYLARLEIKQLHEAVRQHGTQRKAAEALGISRDQLQRRLRKTA